MANRIKSPADPRIEGLTERRGRALAQMRALVDKDDFGSAEDLEAQARLQSEFDGLTAQLDVEIREAERSASVEQADALVEASDATRSRTERQTNEESGLDAAVFQMSRGKPVEPQTMRLDVIGGMIEAFQQGISPKDYAKQFTAPDGMVAQDVVGRVGTSGIHNITAGTSDLRPQNVEARFVETLTQVLSPVRCGYEIVATPRDLSAVKFPKGVPDRANPLTAPDAERESDADIPDRTPDFNFVNTIPREWSARFIMERSAEYATAANISGKFGEYLAREYAQQIAVSTARGANAETEAGIAPALLADAPTQAWLTGIQQTKEAAQGAPTFENVIDVIKKVPVFMAGGGMGPCWFMTKEYSGTLYKMKAGDGHPIFKAGAQVYDRIMDTLYGYPIVYAEDGHLTGDPGATNQIVGIFGDFWAACLLRLAGDMEIASDTGGKYFDRNQVAYRVIGYGASVVKNANQLSYLKSA